MEPGGLQVGVIMVVSAIGEVLRARGETGACLLAFGRRAGSFLQRSLQSVFHGL